MAGRKYEQDRSKVHKTTVAIAFSPEEKKALKQEADAIGMTMSGFIRYCLFVENGIRRK